MALRNTRGYFVIGLVGFLMLGKAFCFNLIIQYAQLLSTKTVFVNIVAANYHQSVCAVFAYQAVVKFVTGAI